MNLRNVVRLSLLFALVTPTFASSVLLQGSGHLYGETPVPVGGQVGQQFTLDNLTLITGIGVGMETVLGGQWAESISGTSWSGSSSPFTLAAGTYDFLITGIACNEPCVSGNAVYLDYYLPASKTQIGGSIGPAIGSPGGVFGFVLQGTTIPSPIPEPGTLTLLGTGILGFAAGTYRKFAKNTASSFA